MLLPWITITHMTISFPHESIPNIIALDENNPHENLTKEFP
jgi:hypothetical protein